MGREGHLWEGWEGETGASVLVGKYLNSMDCKPPSAWVIHRLFLIRKILLGGLATLSHLCSSRVNLRMK